MIAASQQAATGVQMQKATSMNGLLWALYERALVDLAEHLREKGMTYSPEDSLVTIRVEQKYEEKQ